MHLAWGPEIRTENNSRMSDSRPGAKITWIAIWMILNLQVRTRFRVVDLHVSFNDGKGATRYMDICWLVWLDGGEY